MKHKFNIIILILLIFLFFSPNIISNQGFYYGDNLLQRIPTLQFLKLEFTSGRFPLWNPYILGGIPFFADLSNNALAPTNLTYLFFPVPTALNINIYLYLFITALFTYLFGFSLTKNSLASVFSSIIFVFSGSMISDINDINSLQGIALIPVVFYSVEKWRSKRNYKNLIWIIIALSLQFISSHPQYTYYTWLADGFYIFFMFKESYLYRIKILFQVFSITLGLCAIQLLPIIEYSRNSFRPKSIEFATENQVQLVKLPTFILANFFGSWREGTSWGPGSQHETGLANIKGYMGILPLILAGYICFKGKNKKARFWLIVAIIAFLTSLGTQTPIFWLSRSLLPFYSKFRDPMRALSLYSFSIAILAGLALTKIESKIYNEKNIN